jgi:hypothetical protein
MQITGNNNNNITTEHHQAVTHYFKDFNIPTVHYFIILLYLIHYFITDKTEHVMHKTIIWVEDVQ